MKKTALVICAAALASAAAPAAHAVGADTPGTAVGSLMSGSLASGPLTDGPDAASGVLDTVTGLTDAVPVGIESNGHPVAPGVPGQ